ncbi:hypothetical protein CAPTEDRAFT_196184 [Capitella teleta]|uniref:Tesmin/TSO1-like CXC domain-containing protein n=1 Tax=Capitella teleta TaxID=283909 RepID=R7U741_CAPTE|nr:hypothetical protein CAPTEDRAFT_196184 [Capitella teleta]|eukprot:ELT99491.1 hypothetical protein CAPTEDRAFT_196184 [Capitella teleta]
MPRPLPPQPWFPGVLPFSANLPVYLGPQPFYSSIYGGNRRVLLPTPQPSTVKPLTITRRFDLRFIRFGSFQFFSGVNDTSAVSVLCAHQLLVYEMQWACGFATGAHGGCRLTKLFVFIEIPLANIHSACVEGEYLVLTMKPVAQYYKLLIIHTEQWGNEPCWGAPLIAQDGFNEDLTGGQLSAAFHYVQLKKSGACALLDALCTFNDRIRNTLRTVTRWGEPCAPEPRNVVGASATTADGCRCGSFYSCSTRDCDCVAQSAVCSLQCVCMSTLFNCQNPLNIMGGERRICVEQLRADHCLMHMVGKIQGVASYLDAQVLVPCCKVLARVRSLIPSKRPCPAQIPCHRMLEYSWCTGKVHDATLNPRNHCRMCNNCAERDAQHCPVGHKVNCVLTA